MPQNLNIVTSNEQNRLLSAERRSDAANVYAEFSATEPVVFWQEIKNADDHADIVSQEPTGTQHLFLDIPIPISVPSWFNVLEQWYVPTKPNTVDYYEVGKAARWYAVALLDDTTRPNLAPFYVMNTHITNGCEWGDPWFAISNRAKFLRPYWNNHWDDMNTELNRLKDNSAGGLDSTIFIGGDFNRKNSPPFGTAEKLAVGDNKIDKLSVIDRTVDTLLKKTGIISTISDHDAHWARWELTVRP